MTIQTRSSPLARYALYFTEPTPSRRTRQYLCWYFQLRHPRGRTPTPPRLLEMLVERGLGQADVVLALLRLDTMEARRLVEVMIGRAITRCPPALRILTLPPSRGKGDSPKPKDQRRILKVVRNPRHPGTPAYARFEIFQKGRTVEQCLARGATKRDVRMATQFHWIKLEKAA